MKTKNRKGFILLLTVLIMSAISAIVGGLVVSLTSDFRNLSIVTNDAKAFWLAEAGLAHATNQLIKTNGSLTPIGPISLNGGTYSATLSKAGGDITIISTGAINNQIRQLQLIQQERLPYAFDYAVFGANSNTATLNIGNNNPATVVISGDLFYGNGIGAPSETVQVRNNSSVINGLIYSDTATGGGSYTKAVVNPSPVPVYPGSAGSPFSTTYYDSQVANAATAPSNLTLSGTSNLNLAGQTLYYNSVTIRDSATVTGPGTIVSDTTILLRDSPSIGAGVHFISRNAITVRNFATVASGGSFFSQRNNVIVQDSVVMNSALMAPNTGDIVRVINDVTFTGIIYANVVDLSNNAVINGSVVAGRFSGNVIANNVHVTFNQSYLPTSVPTGFTPVYKRKVDSWQEMS